VAEVHHFTYGAFNPVASYLLAFLGSFLGLICTQRARAARSRQRRTRWLVIAAFAIGGAAIWLMHFMAMLGFDVPDSPVRYDMWLTLGSMALAVLTVGIGLVFVGHGSRTVRRVVAGGVFTGLGVMAMHYTGMAAMHVTGEIDYDPALVAASGVIAMVASTVALWFTVSVRGWAMIGGAAAIMGVAVCGMHYTGMAALQVRLHPVLDIGLVVRGIRPLLLIVPITLVTSAVLIGVAFSALQAMTEEEFTAGVTPPRRGVHAEPPWSLRHASLASLRRPTPRPSPRPINRPAIPAVSAVSAAHRD